jgi:hypothetical protein
VALDGASAYIAEGSRVRHVSGATGLISTVAGVGGGVVGSAAALLAAAPGALLLPAATAVPMNLTAGLAVDACGALFVAETGSGHVVANLSRTSAVVGAGDGGGGAASAGGTGAPPTARMLELEADRRVALARWLVGDAAALVSRAIVNRVWHHHFGTGLVSTTSDFGTSGERPSHPALLDWLARRFVDRGWSLKSLHRDIVTSAAYRQASSPVAAAVAVDPDSRLLWRYPPQRLDAESIHDAMLSAAGVLDLSMGGPGVMTFHPKVRQFDEWRPLEDPGPAAWRRMIYLAKMRGTDDGMFKVFDLPDCGQVRDKRGESTTPLQALNLMNGPFTVRMAEKLATRLRHEAGDEPSAQIDRLFAILFSRPPTPAERQACLDTLRSEGLATVCIAAFNSNEFLFRP